MADQWTSATRSWLISFFHILTSHIPSLASPCNNQIPNLTTSVVVDVPLPIDDGAIRTSNAQGTISTMTAGSSQTRTLDSFWPSPLHPIAKMFQRQELGKQVLGFAVPMTTGLLFNQYPALTHGQTSAAVLTLSIGFTAMWNGMLLRGMYPRFASTLECFGVVFVLVTFFGLASSFLPPSLAWACWLFCGFSCLPFLLCLVPSTAVVEESSAERLDEGIV